jgi:3-oxoacyl-[acyl-carrier-protein] synthase II
MVTGVGAVTAAGWGVQRFREALRAGRSTIGPFDRLDHERQRTHVAGQVPPGPPKDFGASCHRLSHAERFALFAACEAVADAGLVAPLDRERAGVFFASTTGGLFESETYFEELVRPNGGEPPRSLLASHALSAPAEAVARHLRVHGPVETVSSACSSGSMAIEQALRAVRTGEVDVALTGGADVLTRTTYSGFNALRAVDERACRPFRADRAGLSLGEGGAVLVLEAFEHVQARGGRSLSEVLGAGSSCDASHMTAPDVEGLGATAAIERALEDAGIDPGAIDLVNAHATGTPLNDAAEYAALRRVFGERASTIPIEATKGILGHLLGTAGAIEAVSTVLGLVDREARPTPGNGDIDPALAVDLVLGAARPMPGMNTALSLSLGFGGANAAVVFGRWRDH